MPPAVSGPDLTEVRRRAVQAADQFLRTQMADWPADGSSAKRLGELAVYADCAPAKVWHIEILVDGHLRSAHWEAAAEDAPLELILAAVPAIHPKDAAIVLLAAAAQLSGRRVRMPYPYFRELYEATPDGSIHVAPLPGHRDERGT